MARRHADETLRARLLPLLVLGAAASLTTPGFAQAVDCDALKSSQIPYQLTHETVERRNTTERKVLSISQVNRDPSGVNTVYEAALSASRPVGSLKRLRAGIFMLQTPEADRTITSTYAGIDPKSFDYETKQATYTVNLTNDRGETTSAATHTYSFIERSTVVIGPCQFQTVRYKLDSAWTNGHTATAIQDYAPELAAVVSSQQEGKSDGRPYVLTQKATDLTAAFKPLH